MSAENIIALLAALGVGGILVAFLNSYIEQRKQTKEHDIRIFRESNEILTEQNLLEIANVGLFYNNAIDNDKYSKIKAWCMFFGEAGNQFLNKRLVKLSQELLNRLSILVIYIENNFFTKQRRGSNDKNEYLYPITNIDQGDSNSENMMSHTNELEELIGIVLISYGKYRVAIKHLLKI